MLKYFILSIKKQNIKQTKNLLCLLNLLNKKITSKKNILYR